VFRILFHNDFKDVHFMLRKTFNAEEGKVLVDFSLPANLTNDAEEVLLVGDFNDWVREGEKRIIMYRFKDVFNARYELDMNKEYQYLYVAYSGEQISWIIDSHADKYTPSPLRGGNSVVITHDFSDQVQKFD
jgi:1,4-alpha-glucan branching enzyme